MSVPLTRSMASAVERQLEPWTTDAAPGRRPTFERHDEDLVALAGSLKQAGHARDTIRACIRDLNSSHQAGLAQALAADIECS